MFQEAGVTIPTPDDLLVTVVARMREVAVTNDASGVDIVSAAVADVFTSKTATDADLFNLIAYAKGCHEMAAIYRAQDRHETADLFHVLGQDMLAKAGAVFSELMVVGINTAGIARH